MEQLDHVNLALLIVRVTFGVGFAAHGYRKVIGGLDGTARWFGSIGMKLPALQARMAAGTEIGAGLLLALGLLTPFAAAGMIGVMTVAGWATHRTNGFFIVDNGWEYVAGISIVAWLVASIGPGRWSLDHAIGLDFGTWGGMVIAALVGVGSGIAQLALFYRPPADDAATS